MNKKRVAAYDGGMKQTFNNILLSNIAQSEWEQNNIDINLKKCHPFKKSLSASVTDVKSVHKNPKGQK